jgi:hypothetical protein
VNARHGRGFAFGSMTTERTATNNCTDLLDSNPNNLRFCERIPPFRTLFKGRRHPAALRDPGGGHVPGAAGDPAGRGLHGDERGRRPAVDGWRRQSHGEPRRPDDHLYSYVFTNDFRVSRLFRFGKTRVQGFAEIFNLVNDSTIFTRNETYGPQA